MRWQVALEGDGREVMDELRDRLRNRASVSRRRMQLRWQDTPTEVVVAIVAAIALMAVIAIMAGGLR